MKKIQRKFTLLCTACEESEDILKSEKRKDIECQKNIVEKYTEQIHDLIFEVKEKMIEEKEDEKVVQNWSPMTKESIKGFQSVLEDMLESINETDKRRTEN